MRFGHGPPHGSPHDGEHRRRSRVPRALRRGLQRRIFIAFGATIVLTGLVVAGVMNLVGGGGWQRDVERARRFASRQLAAVWNDPPRRKTLLEGIANDLELGITLFDNAGERIDATGGLCQRRALQVRIFDPTTGLRLGRAEVCPTGALMAPTQRALLGFGAALVFLWGASGMLARRLSRPLVEVAEVAREIGRGRLASRERLTRHGHKDESDIVATALYDAAGRIEKQLADQRALLAAVSHEIRTPLARMRLLVELAETSKEKLPEIDREIVELDRLVADLLAGARVDFSALSLVKLDARRLATEALERASLAPELLEAEGGELTLEGDATLLGRALTNLVENALKHAGAVERVTVSREGAALVFAVLDRGPGIPRGDEARIFEPFYRHPDAAQGGYGGSVGLGLALVKRIAEAHGGAAFAEARDGGGARIGFSVRGEANGV